jgi:hypothetical protein
LYCGRLTVVVLLFEVPAEEFPSLAQQHETATIKINMATIHPIIA